jgi:hypothetical protein
LIVPYAYLVLLICYLPFYSFFISTLFCVCLFFSLYYLRLLYLSFTVI